MPGSSEESSPNGIGRVLPETVSAFEFINSHRPIRRGDQPADLSLRVFHTNSGSGTDQTRIPSIPVGEDSVSCADRIPTEKFPMLPPTHDPTKRTTNPPGH